MKKITVKDVRAAIMYVCQSDGINLDKPERARKVGNEM